MKDGTNDKARGSRPLAFVKGVAAVLLAAVFLVGLSAATLQFLRMAESLAGAVIGK